MPVKNVKRKTNDGFEGVITGLNDKEKEIIANSVGIEANPTDEATETLEKIKIDNVAYNVGGGGSDDGAKYYPISDFMDMGSGSVISGAYNTMHNLIQQGKFLGLTTGGGPVFHYIGDFSGNDKFGILLCYFNVIESGNDSCHFYAFQEDDTLVTKDDLLVPDLNDIPNYSSAKTYVLKHVNGKITWIEE